MTANLKAELKEGHRGSGKTMDLITGKMKYLTWSAATFPGETAHKHILEPVSANLYISLFHFSFINYAKVISQQWKKAFSKALHNSSYLPGGGLKEFQQLLVL